MRLEAELILALPASEAAVRMARTASRCVEALLPEPRAHALELLVSELVTNAVVHPSDQALNRISFELVVFDDLLRVEIQDRGFGFTPPRLPSPGEGTADGWGLYLVDELADRWGVRRGRGGIWFELLRPR